MNNQLIAVEFRNHQIQTVQQNEMVFVVLRRVVENLGLSWSSQYQKIDKLCEKFSCVDINTTGSDGKTYQMLCIPLRKLNGWLFSINPNKVRADIRPALVAYQEECFSALHDYFTKGAATRKPKNAPECRYRVKLVIYDSLMGTAVELLGTGDEMRQIASGISTDLGYKPNSFTHVPMNRAKFKQIH